MKTVATQKKHTCCNAQKVEMTINCKEPSTFVLLMPKYLILELTALSFPRNIMVGLGIVLANVKVVGGFFPSSDWVSVEPTYHVKACSKRVKVSLLFHVQIFRVNLNPQNLPPS